MRRLFVVFLLITLSYAEIPTIVTTEWLKKHYDDRDLVLIDVRDGEAFAKAHLRRAVNWPRWKVLFDIKHNYLLPSLDLLQHYFSQAGIDRSKKLVFYGNNEIVWAARAYWIAQLLGDKNTAILRVGFNEAQKVLPISKKLYKPKPTHFMIRIDPSILKTKLDVFMALHKAIIIDGRPPEYYKGIVSAAKRKGHIPGAINIPGSMNYDKYKGVKSVEQLAKLYKDLPKDKEIILYCQDGADAALNFIAMRLLGFQKVAVYDGSWFEWADDLNLPIECSEGNDSKSGNSSQPLKPNNRK